jgi:hypothetical protein
MRCTEVADRPFLMVSLYAATSVIAGVIGEKHGPTSLDGTTKSDTHDIVE